MGHRSAKFAIGIVVSIIAQGLFVLSSSLPAHAAVGFGKSVLSGASSLNPTSIQFGPDGKLYVAQRNGLIKVYTVKRKGPNAYQVTATSTIDAITKIANHNDDGALNPNVKNRLVTGLLVTGSSQAPIIYVTSSDPRIGAGSHQGDLNLDTNSGVISRLKWNGAGWNHVQSVQGLPRSEENHTGNGLALDAASNTLYIAYGGHTNKGGPSHNFADLAEYWYSAAILSIDLDKIGNGTYKLPTLRGTPTPWGGDDGKNQAIYDPGGPVQVYAPGFRNPYDLVITQAGRMYVTDNGPNGGWGDQPKGEGTANCDNQPVSQIEKGEKDRIHLVTPGYYGGHPNPTRANPDDPHNIALFGGNVAPGKADRPIECDYQDFQHSDAFAQVGASTNGITEYTASNFSNAMKGDLLAAGYVKHEIVRLQLNPSGTDDTSNGALFSNVGFHPLDITSQGDGGAFPGTIWVAAIGDDDVYVFEPNDFGGGGGGPVCSGADDPELDEDGDKYSNRDEIKAGTDPCSKGDVPHDWDKDHISDVTDPDDDNDGIPDTRDPFAIDPHNGSTNPLPVSYTWENDADNPGGLLGLGFTGLMTNRRSNYATRYDIENITAGGAAGVTTVERVGRGDAFKRPSTCCPRSSNKQRNAFQFGVSPPKSGRFRVHTRIVRPFDGLTPRNYQSMGLFIGRGDQNNYAKITTAMSGGTIVQFIKEQRGRIRSRGRRNISMPGPDQVDLYLTVNVSKRSVRPSYRVRRGGVTRPRKYLGKTRSLPGAWLKRSLAIGIISTSRGPGGRFPATWDFIKVRAIK
jgi:glucose/arabinose dehydrogenase